MRLNIGAGKEKCRGYVTLDNSPQVNPGILADLEKKLPIKDNSYTEIVANHILEHIENINGLMKELNRISKEGAIIKIRVPFYLSVGAFMDPTHKRFFTPFTMNYFCDSHYNYETTDKPIFKIKKVELRCTFTRKLINKIFNPILNLNHNFYCKFLTSIIPCAEIYYELKVLK